MRSQTGISLNTTNRTSFIMIQDINNSDILCGETTPCIMNSWSFWQHILVLMYFLLYWHLFHLYLKELEFILNA